MPVCNPNQNADLNNRFWGLQMGGEMWYLPKMFLFGNSIRASRNTIRRLTLMLVVSFLCCTILQGSTHCFCSSEDEAGSEEHSEHHPQSHAGGYQCLVAEANYEHLTFGNMQPSERSRVGCEKIAGALSANVKPMLRPQLLLARPLPQVQDAAFRCSGLSRYPLIFIAHSIQILC
jgi:hypothetical protein